MNHINNISIRKLYSFGLAAWLLLSQSSCTDRFMDYNTNPHHATEEMMSWDNLYTGAFFAQMQKNVFVIEQLPEIGANTYQIIQNLAGDVYSGYMGACGTWNGGSNNTTYDLSNDWKDAGFSNAFVRLMPAWKQLSDKAKEIQQPQVAALATIVKVEAMHRMTDMYGPLPYVNFGKGGFENNYDSQEAIYDSFFDELNNAIALLTDFNTKDPSAKILENYDYIFGGDVKSWIKFANTLKLRLAMRIVYANQVKAKTMAEEAVNHPIGVITNANEAVKLNHTEKLIYRHPLYVIGVGEFNDVRMGATIDSYMNGYNDPRISSYFKLSNEGKYTGIRNGINIISEKYREKAPFSDLNISSSSNLVWMNPAEGYFLRAEGALRGWSMGGTAKDLYEQGVKTSFAFSNASGVEAYLQDETKTPAAYTDPSTPGNSIALGNSQLGTITIKWKDSDSFERKLERIITQKWLAIFPDGQEAWSEFRRTGYPKIFPVMINNSGNKISTEKQIRRIPFPNSEYRDNRSAVDKATVLLSGEDHGGTRLWWDKK